MSVMHTVLVCCCCCNKFPQTWRLKTTHRYYLTLLEVRNANGSHWASVQVLAELSLLEALERICFLPWQLREAARSLGWETPPIFHLQVQQPHHSNLCFHPHITFFESTLLPPSITYKDSVITLGAPR